MIKEIMGAGAIVSMLMPNKKKHHSVMPNVKTAATLIGIGVGAYLALKNQNDKGSHRSSNLF
ncbi:hypothetical protein [Clostridium thermarum]|uniref:hypothetical protein n=1 Tax=Clostridium thermarum TaxID=1716543 RepID=UPI001123A352|nr:hypothetical protein [Clostridium thermarum]